ncbi:hypothetical protein HBI22_232950 [Parastagonospora nodorum]|nr:hypothetical protein HBI22_232950 [Parastagonospora nodorum]
MLFLTSCATERLAGELATVKFITAKELLIARGNVSNAVCLSRLKADQYFFTILFAFIINYILETSSRTYNKAY